MLITGHAKSYFTIKNQNIEMSSAAVVISALNVKTAVFASKKQQQQHQQQ